MSRNKKIGLKIFKYASISIIGLILLVTLLVNSPIIQTHLSNRFLQKRLAENGFEFYTEEVKLHLWKKRLSLKNIFILDQHGAEMLKACNVDIEVGRINRNMIDIKSIYVNKGAVHLSKYPDAEQLNLGLFINSFKNENASQSNIGIICKRLEIHNFDLSHSNQKTNAQNDVKTLNPNDLYFSDIDLTIEHFSLQDDQFYGNIKHISTKEKSGLEIKRFSGLLMGSSQDILCSDMQIKTNRSTLDFNLNTTSSSWDDYRDFINKVTLQIDFRSSTIETEDLKYFSPRFENVSNYIYLSGLFSGKLHELESKNLILSYAENTHFEGQIKLNGLPKIQETFFNLSIKNLATNISDLEQISLPDSGRIDIPDNFRILEKINLSGQLTGFLNDFNLVADIGSNLGDVKTDVVLNQNDSAYTFKGLISGNGILLGEILEQPKYFDKISVDAEFDGFYQNPSKHSINFDVKTKDFDYLDYSVDEFNINGSLTDNLLKADLALADDDARITVSGQANILEMSNIDIIAQVRNLDISKYELLADSNEQILNLDLVSDITKIGIDHESGIDTIDGIIKLSNVSITTKDSVYKMNQLIATQREISNGQHIQVFCDFFKAEMRGRYALLHMGQIWEDLKKSYANTLNATLVEAHQPIVDRLKDKVVKQNTKTPKPDYAIYQNFTFNLEVAKVSDLMSYFIPTLELPYGAKVNLKYNTQHKDGVSFLIEAKDPSYKNIYMHELSGQGSTGDSLMQFELKVKDFHLGSTNYFDDFLATAEMQNSQLSWHVNWYGEPARSPFKGNLDGNVDIISKDKILLNIGNSNFAFDHREWSFDSNNLLTIDSSGIHLANFRLSNVKNEEENLNLFGSISKEPSDVFSIFFNNFDLSITDVLSQRLGIDFNGNLSGEVTLSNLYYTPFLKSNLTFNDFSVNDFMYGRAAFSSEKDFDSEGIKVHFEITDSVDFSKQYIVSDGYFFPENKTNSLNIQSQVSDLDMSFIKNHIASFSSDLTGKCEGTVMLTGSLRKPVISGELTPINSQIKIDFLNTYYDILSGNVALDMKEIKLEDFLVQDIIYNTQADVNGVLSHSMFKNFALNLQINPDHFLTLNTTRQNNESFFGKAFCTGNVRVFGPANNIHIEAHVRTDRGTEIQIPFTNRLNISDDNFITFVNTQKSEEGVAPYQPPLARPRSNNLSILLDLDITPDATVIFDMNIPPTTGLINATGNGNLRIVFEKNKNLSIFGDYTFQDGYYDFSLQNLVSRRFNIERGGTLTWTGVPGDAMIDMSAIYTTRASLYPVLEGNTSSINEIPKNKVTVQSVIGLSGKMSQPNINFDMRLPTVDEDIRSQFLTLISPNDEMTKQTFSLLLFNTLTTVGDNSNIANNSSTTNLTSSTAYEVASSQLSAILSQLVSDVDVGVNYKPADVNSTEQFQVQLSTQIFDNRVTIDGNVSIGGTSRDVVENENTNASDLMGELNIEYRITDKVNLKYFSRPNERNFINSQSTYSHGAGIGYKISFYSLKDVLRDMFTRKKKKEKDAAVEEKDVQKENIEVN